MKWKLARNSELHFANDALKLRLWCCFWFLPGQKTLPTHATRLQVRQINLSSVVKTRGAFFSWDKSARSLMTVRTLFRRPLPSPTLPRDHLDPTIGAALLPGIKHGFMHGICHSPPPKNCSCQLYRSSFARCPGGGLMPVTIHRLESVSARPQYCSTARASQRCRSDHPMASGVRARGALPTFPPTVFAEFMVSVA